MPTTLMVAAVILRDNENRLLTVRKHGAAMFMLPGGKVEPGETTSAAAARELAEELGIKVSVDALRLLGHWLGAAANEENTFVDSTAYSSNSRETPAVAAEIAEFSWLDMATAPGRHDLAPLLLQYVIPALINPGWTAETSR